MKYIYEFIGTFFLVFTVATAAISGWAPQGFAPLAIGSVLMVMIYAGGHVSGGHYNPAVSFGVMLRGSMTFADMIIYWVAQLVGGTVAALLVIYLEGPAASPMTMNMIPVLIVEALFTFALVFVVLNVATAKGTEGNSYFGLAIGFTVLAGAYAVGGISGGVFNPAVAVGITVMGVSAWADIWIYFAAQLVGGALAALAFRAADPGEAAN